MDQICGESIRGRRTSSKVLRGIITIYVSEGGPISVPPPDPGVCVEMSGEWGYLALNAPGQAFVVGIALSIAWMFRLCLHRAASGLRVRPCCFT
jgi:hypothetical protein